eukprot:5511717-Prymnesium_polylepis.1
MRFQPCLSRTALRGLKTGPRDDRHGGYGRLAMIHIWERCQAPTAIPIAVSDEQMLDLAARLRRGDKTSIEDAQLIENYIAKQTGGSSIGGTSAEHAAPPATGADAAPAATPMAGGEKRKR